MKPKPETIKKLIRYYGKLRAFSHDPFEARFAQAMETALRWAVEDTTGWHMKDEPKEMARCLKVDLNHLTPESIKKLY